MTKDSFSKSSKPKVINFGENLNSHYVDNVEVINLDRVTNEELVALNPDLIVTDAGKSDEVPELLGNNLNLRRRWIEVTSNDGIGIHQSAVLNSLLQYDDLISIFTSAYNIGNKILETYESLVRQTYGNWEWVIVDDSTDSTTYEILKKIADNDSRVKVFSFAEKSKGNIGEAKYRAAMLCSGTYLVELDHDDLLTEDCLELLLTAFLTFPQCGFAYSDCVEIDKDGNSLTYPEGFAFGYSHHYRCMYNGKEYIPASAPTLNPKSIRHIVSVPNHVRAWRADVYHQLRGHNRRMRIADDYELIVRTFLVTEFVHIPKMLYLQRFDGTNSQDSNDNRNDIQIRVREIADFYSENITKRFEELGYNDFCKGIDLETLYATVHDPNTPMVNKTLVL